jgi:uncharacterized protein
MVEESQVREFVQRLAGEFLPQRVVLFGSYARGNPSPDSDVDLLVIMPTKKRGIQQALEIRQRVSCPFPLDLLVKTPEDVDHRLALQDSFLISILKEGKTLYESPRR